MKKPLVLMILDGWGINENKDQLNAITEANPVNYNNFLKEYPNTRLAASGEEVGLPNGQMGNSEVGHTNIGAGRVVYQALVKITKEIREGQFFENETLVKAMENAKNNGTALHLSGLLSDGGVHSHISHISGLLKMAKNFGIKNVYIHAILDGRDTPPKSALTYVEQLEKSIAEIGVGKIATLSGRYYAMDRDKNWNRVEKAYNAIANGEGTKNIGAKKAIEVSYMEDITDEFVKPTVITDNAGNPTAVLKDNDSFIFFNYRPDRAREITRAINDKEFTYFVRENNAKVHYVCMTEYDSTIDAEVAYAPENLTNTLGEVLKNNNLTQLRTAETEKYAHVTFFFNGGLEEPFENEDRALVSSPKVDTYDLKPEMSALELTEGLLEKIEEEKYDVIIVNYANTDMVGHTGVFSAAKTAVEVVDKCAKEVVDKVLEKGGTVLITADHGNVDLMEDPISHVPFTAHTTNDVPLIVVSNEFKNVSLKENGKLADIAPTMLKMLKIEIPSEMTGEVLIKD